MKVLFTMTPWAGHYYPAVPLGWALQAAGHDVRVLCSPLATQWVKDSGLTAVPLLNDYDNKDFWARLWHQQRVLRGVAVDHGLPLLHPLTGERMECAEDFDWPAYKRLHEHEFKSAWLTKMQRTMVYVKTWNPDLIVHDMMSTEGPFAAIMHNIPAVLNLWGPVGTEELEPDAEETGWRSSGTKILPEYSNGILERLGVTRRGSDLVRYVIDPCPPQLEPRTQAARIPMRYVPYNGPTEAPLWTAVAPDRRRVCVVWGHTLSRYGEATFLVPRVLQALADLDVEVLVAINNKDRAYLGEIPGNAQILGQFPLHLLLPTCDAVVHHGGAGAVMNAVVTGLPQLALPFESEQVANATRLAESGAGIHIPGKDADLDTIRVAVRRLLDDPSYRTVAGTMRVEHERRPTPIEVVPRLEEIARTGQPPATVDWSVLPLEKMLADASRTAWQPTLTVAGI